MDAPRVWTHVSIDEATGTRGGDASPHDRTEQRPSGPPRQPLVVELRARPSLEQVYAEAYRPLLVIARAVLADTGDAEEVVQEAFARTLARWDDVREVHDPLPYLRSAVLNLCRGRFRRKPTPLALARPAPSAEAEAGRSARRDAVLAALATLPRRQREVVALRYFGELSTQETADALGIAPGTVTAHLHRAISALESTLEEHRHD
jgi:RNA polymerase sigma-70 factor (sigma-E family)